MEPLDLTARQGANQSGLGGGPQQPGDNKDKKDAKVRSTSLPPP